MARRRRPSGPSTTGSRATGSDSPRALRGQTRHVTSPLSGRRHERGFLQDQERRLRHSSLPLSLRAILRVPTSELRTPESGSREDESQIRRGSPTGLALAQTTVNAALRWATETRREPSRSASSRARVRATTTASESGMKGSDCSAVKPDPRP